jgi:hypothetical protein
MFCLSPKTASILAVISLTKFESSNCSTVVNGGG